MSIPNLFWRIVRPLYKRLTRAVPVEDPWEELSLTVPLARYGAGLEDDFTIYLRGPSNVSVSSVEDIREWLSGCTYRRDQDQFGRDYWQHLLEFERRREGDCDDYAIWAWRKLIEIGRDARLVTGRCIPFREDEAGHAWVVFHDAGTPFVFDGTSSPENMIRPLDEVRGEYLPEYGVDSRGKRFTYSGALLVMKKQFGIPPHRSDAPTG